MTKKPETVNKLDQLSLVESQLRFKGNYKNGKPDGLWEEYEENGQLWSKENYKNGIPDGPWEIFNEEGKLTKTLEWKDGELIE